MSLLTRAESSRFTETSLHADVMRFVAGLEGRGDPRLHVSTFGQSGLGKDLPLLVLSSAGVATPEEARKLGRPIVLVINGIHAGEVEGKEAAMMLARDLLDGRHAGILDEVTLVIVPLFNPDGNDALDPGNRALHLPKLTGQLGPNLVGTRVNAAKINLNRDYMRQEAVEMRLLQTRVCQPWAADLTIDNHATNGSIHRFAMTYDVPHTIESGAAAPIRYMADTLLPPVTRALRANWGIEAGWYGNFVEDERVLDASGEADPTSPVREGWMTYPHHPRFGSNYRGLTGRMDLLLECYSYISFEERVRTAYAFMVETLRHVADHRDDVLQTVAASRTPPSRVAVRYRLDAQPQPIEILTRTPRTLDGAPTSVTLPHYARFVGTTVVDRPRAYVVPASLAEHLRRHGLTVGVGSGVHDVEIATITHLAAEDGRAILEAARVGELAVAWMADRRDLTGLSVVSTDQPLGAIAVYLCEPESDDGAVENGVLPAPKVGEAFPVWRVR